MCGIAGVVHLDGRRAIAAVRAMNAAQAHRGPDDEGLVHVDAGGRALVLGHRRLAVIDLSAAAHQPMVHPDTGDVLVYNGEVYNYRALRGELEAAGERFRSRSDTEVILRAFARDGAASFQRLSGMFAFAIYEASARRLHLVRDPLGIKPLYVAMTNEGAVFASELRAIMASGVVDDRIDRRALASALAYGAVASPLTMIEGVRAVEPGTSVVIELGTNRPLAESQRSVRFDSFAAHARRERCSRIASELRPLLHEAVASHMQSDVPVGIFLSRGIDSTAVASVASELRGGAVDTFTVGLAEDESIDEGPSAARIARALGTRHHDIRIAESEVRVVVDRALASFDQPSVDGLNTYIISRAVRERGIVVALSGIGGDEMFGGYSTFREVPLLRRALLLTARVSAAARTGAIDALLHRRPVAQRRKAMELAGSDGSLTNVYFARRRLLSDQQMGALGFSATEHDVGFVPQESDPARDLASDDDWADVRMLETRFYLGNTLLRDTDVAGMANGLEIRVPLLDRRVVEAAMRYSCATVYLRRRSNKPWLVAALGDRMPSDVARLPKRGFSLPQERWMRTWLKEGLDARIDLLARSGLVDPKGAVTIWRDFLGGSLSVSWSRAWMLGALGSWLGNRHAPARQSAEDGVLHRGDSGTIAARRTME